MARLRLKAKRSGLWFRALRRIDRALVDLTIFVADGVRSAVLARSLSSVVKKLEELAESRLQRLTREVGVFLARKRALLAQKWGNLSAHAWVADLCFARFLAAMRLNESGFLKLGAGVGGRC